ncbi:MAG: hypothetical protein LBB34_03695 [Holosporales bacterium]|jgi:acyl carrier protein|nr:hypothetical protein [Holosporales bacterium]
MKTTEIVSRIEAIFERIGVYLEDFDQSDLLEEIILDSLAYISFYIEIENEFDVEFSDEFYEVDVSEYTICEFAEKVIMPLIAEGTATAFKNHLKQ